MTAAIIIAKDGVNLSTKRKWKIYNEELARGVKMFLVTIGLQGIYRRCMDSPIQNHPSRKRYTCCRC